MYSYGVYTCNLQILNGVLPWLHVLFQYLNDRRNRPVCQKWLLLHKSDYSALSACLDQCIELPQQKEIFSPSVINKTNIQKHIIVSTNGQLLLAYITGGTMYDYIECIVTLQLLVHVRILLVSVH